MWCSSYNPHSHVAFPLSIASFIDDAWKEIGNKTRVTIEQGSLRPYQSSFMLLQLNDFSKRAGKRVGSGDETKHTLTAQE